MEEVLDAACVKSVLVSRDDTVWFGFTIPGGGGRMKLGPGDSPSVHGLWIQRRPGVVGCWSQFLGHSLGNGPRLAFCLVSPTDMGDSGISIDRGSASFAARGVFGVPIKRGLGCPAVAGDLGISRVRGGELSSSLRRERLRSSEA